MKKIFTLLLLFASMSTSVTIFADESNNLDYEIVSKRTESTKTFRNDDGSFEVAMYDDVIHYQDEEGNWKQVNNSLVENEENVENTSNKFKIKFPKKLDDNKKIEFKFGEYSIDWSVLEIESSDIFYINEDVEVDNPKELLNVTQSILYSDIQENVDLEYIIGGSGVKENIILSDYIENFSLTFEFNLKNLSLIEDKEGNFVFVNEDNEVISQFDNLYMYDSTLHDSQDIEFRISNIDSKTFEVEVIPNNEWLENATYPVTIDPTIVMTTVSTSTTYDTYIYSGAASTNYSSYTYMVIANTSYTYQYRGLIYFYIPSTLMDKTIVYSYLYLTASSKTQGRQINIYQNTEYFASSSATWSNSPNYNNDVIDSHVVGTSDIYEFNITRSVWDWQDTGNTRTTGFTIADSQTFGAYNSVKQMDYSDPTLRPKITIGYFDFGPTVSGPGAARDYVDLSYGLPNCYGYAINRFDDNHTIQPGEFSTGAIQQSEISDVNNVAINVITDFFEFGRRIRGLDNYNSLIYSDEYRIALRVTENGFVIDGVTYYDYHFMVQTSDGRWSHKGGTSPSILLGDGVSPETAYWGAIPYNSEILYFAIKD